MKKIFEGILSSDEIIIEDQGKAILTEPINDPNDENLDAGMFVRLQSWDDDKIHSDFKQFIGKKIKITVEII